MFKIKIDTDYLKNEFGFEDKTSLLIQQANLIDTHWNVYGYVQQEMFGRPSIEQIGDYVTNGSYEYVDRFGWTGKIECPVLDEEERLNLFKRAIAKQYIYDYVNGRSSMVGGGFAVCPDSMMALKILGLLRKQFDEFNQ